MCLFVVFCPTTHNLFNVHTFSNPRMDHSDSVCVISVNWTYSRHPFKHSGDVRRQHHHHHHHTVCNYSQNLQYLSSNRWLLFKQRRCCCPCIQQKGNYMYFPPSLSLSFFHDGISTHTHTHTHRHTHTLQTHFICHRLHTILDANSVIIHEHYTLRRFSH